LLWRAANFRYNNPDPRAFMKVTADMSSIPLAMPNVQNPAARGSGDVRAEVRAASATSTAPADASVSDAVLVERLRAGETPAGESLVRRHYQHLVRYLQRLVGSEHLAEELHQQTWLSVLEHLDKFDPKNCAGGFKAWLFRIATNKANDHWRSAGREKAAKDGLRLVTDEELPAAGHRLEGTEQEAKLKRAIEKLPEAQKQVLMLRYYSGLKFVEIAQMLGCPLNTALGRMHKAMLKLKELMAD
jgi:RNA polymerase sigma-70 factor (ECF subfamily)